MAVDGLQTSRTATETPSSSQVAPGCEPHGLGGAVTAAIAAHQRELTGRQARPPALDRAGRVAAASRAPYATLDHHELLDRARNEGEARSKNAKRLVTANLAKIKLKADLESARKKLEKLEKAAAKEARAREKRASQLAKAAAGKRVVVQIGPEQIETARTTACGATLRARASAPARDRARRRCGTVCMGMRAWIRHDDLPHRAVLRSCASLRCTVHSRLRCGTLYGTQPHVVRYTASTTP